MRFTLHDNLHGSAGPAHPESRQPVTDAARAPWVTALHKWLGQAGRQAGPRSGELNLGRGKLRMRVSRFGDALAVTWTAGPDWRVVAATVLLTGRAASHDDAAIDALRRHAPRLPFEPADYAALAGESRPCIGTMYLDARWFDNGGVELAATALALAAWVGPDATLAVRAREAEPPRAEPHRVEPPPRAEPRRAEPRRVEPRRVEPCRVEPPPRAQPQRLDFARDRFELVVGMVKKKVAAALGPVAGVHFRVYPPPQYLEHPEVLRGGRVFEQLRDTTWWVRWHDGQLDRLSFGEFLGFIDQVVGVGEALRDARSPNRLAPPLPVNESVWATSGPRRELRVRRTLDTRQLVQDARIRQLFDAVALEPPATNQANSSSVGRVTAGR